MVVSIALVVLLAQSSATLPPEFCRAADLLFASGMPDPRLGNLHEVVIKNAPEENFGRSFSNYGWVMPRNDLGKRSMVALNGQSYEVEKIGKSVTLEELMLLLVPSFPDQEKGDSPKTFPVTDMNRFASDTQRRPHFVNLTAAAMMYRLGKEDYADLLIQQNSGRGDAGQMLVSQYVQSLRGQVVNFHRMGRWNDIITSTRSYALHKSELEGAASIPKSLEGAGGIPEDAADAFRIIDSLRPEARRRNSGPNRPPLAQRDLARMSATDRIVALIDRLDEEPSHGGHVALPTADGPFLPSRELLAIGTPAVSRLLEVVETDDRLTRSVPFERFYVYRDWIVPVWRVAADILRAIWNQPPLERSVDREAALEILRTTWIALTLEKSS